MKFKTYPMGYFHVDIVEVRTEEGKLYLFVGIDRTSKFAYAELHEKANRTTARNFLECLIAAVPYPFRTILTDNGLQFTNRKRDGSTAPMTPFDRLCLDNAIEHRLTKVPPPGPTGRSSG